jgi:ComF family protein
MNKKVFNYLAFVPQIIQNILWPKLCFGCGKYVKEYICKECFLKYFFINNEQNCFFCNKYSKNGMTHKECKDFTYIDQLIVFAKYDGLLVKMLKDGKYSRAFQIYIDLTKFAFRHSKHIFSKKLKKNTIISSVPLHKYKKRDRGFNQAFIIAKQLSKELDITHDDILVRKKYTLSQTTKNKRQRSEDLLDAFSIKKKFQNKLKGNIVLVDDILTSGATLNSCAKILRDNGCERVIAFVIASER